MTQGELTQIHSKQYFLLVELRGDGIICCRYCGMEQASRTAREPADRLLVPFELARALFTDERPIQSISPSEWLQLRSSRGELAQESALCVCFSSP